MFGLIIVLGMLVDDGIIVSENVYRYMEEGLPPREASIKGSEEVQRAVVAAVMTTCAAFSPLLFITKTPTTYARPGQNMAQPSSSHQQFSFPDSFY